METNGTVAQSLTSSGRYFSFILWIYWETISCFLRPFVEQQRKTEKLFRFMDFKYSLMPINANKSLNVPNGSRVIIDSSNKHYHILLSRIWMVCHEQALGTHVMTVAIHLCLWFQAKCWPEECYRSERRPHLSRRPCDATRWPLEMRQHVEGRSERRKIVFNGF